VEVDYQLVPVNVGDRKMEWLVIDPVQSSKRYLYSFSTKYFYYLLETHSAALDQENIKFHAATATRQLYMQVLETTMAFFAAMIQASHAVPLWMQKYNNHDLQLVIGQIDKGVIVVGQAATLDLEFMAEKMTENFKAGDASFDMSKIKQAIKDNLPKALKYLMADFLDSELNSEYNSIKHGLRLSSGPTSLSLTSPETGETLTLGAEFSSSFPVVHDEGDKPKKFRLSRTMLGFDPAHTLHRIRACINMLEFLRFQLHLAYHDQIDMQLRFPLTEEIVGGWETASATGILTRMTEDF
jgi:hypothetical protein